jgi:MFS family permease
MAAVNMQMMTRSLLVYRITGSAAILGSLALANALPMLFLSLFGGVIADKFRKKNVLLIGQISSAIVALGVALSLTLGFLSVDQANSWWILIVASIFQGAILGLIMPARQAIIPEIVGEDQLMNALSLNNLGRNVFSILAPASAGFLIDIFDFQAVYYSMTGLFLLAFIFTSLMPFTGETGTHGGGVIKDIINGLQYIRSATTTLFVLAFTLVAFLLAMPYIYMMPIFADSILEVGATGMGVLLSVSGLGAITASLVLASLPNKKRGAMLLISGLIMGLALVGFAFSTYWYLSLILIVFVGVGQTGFMTLGNTLIQYYVAPEYRGRVMSNYWLRLSAYNGLSVDLL